MSAGPQPRVCPQSVQPQSLGSDSSKLASAFACGTSHPPVEHPLHPSEGSTRMAITDTTGSGLSPLSVAPGPATERALQPEGLTALRRVATRMERGRTSAVLSREAACDAPPDRTMRGAAGLLPRSQKLLRIHQSTPRGRRPTCNNVIHALRTRLEQSSPDPWAPLQDAPRRAGERPRAGIRMKR
jgi:hypothetical protein